MRAWFSRLFDMRDRSVDLLPILLILYAAVALTAVGEFLALAAYDVIALHHDFHATDYGTGFGAVLTATGLAALAHCWKWPGGGDPPQTGVQP